MVSNYPSVTSSADVHERTSATEPVAAVLARIIGGMTPARVGELPDSDAAALPPPSCPRCNDLGFVYRNVPDDHPEYGRTGPCRCQPGRAEKIARYWQKYSGVPARLRDLRLDTHPNLHGGQNPGLLARLEQAGVRASWFFWGDFGRGKSAIAAALAWRFLEETGESVLWRTVPDLLEEVRQTYQRPRDDDAPAGLSEYELVSRYTSVGLLALDDLGAERLKQTGPDSWAAEVLFRVINRRHGDQRPTVFTANITLGEVAERIGERTAWRIAEMCNRRANEIELTGKNLRDPRGG